MWSLYSLLYYAGAKMVTEMSESPSDKAMVENENENLEIPGDDPS